MSVQAKTFPFDAVKKFADTYQQDVGQRAKILVVSHEDYLCYILGAAAGINLNMRDQLAELGLEITTGDYLKKGEMDLALGIKED